MRLSPYPARMAARVFMLHGTMSMPSVRKDPLEMAAAWSLTP
jgi:hypothetical protein